MTTQPIPTVALLRGINLGKRRIKMDDLRAGFTSWGYAPVKTFLAAGNVLFHAPPGDTAALAATLEELLAARYGYPVPVIIRTLAELQALVAAEPFQGVDVTPNTRRYVTFLAAPPPRDLAIPRAAPGDPFRILSIHGGDVCSVLTLDQGSRTVDAMAILEQIFGSRVTTRNWNTVHKIAAG
jgi:uncharacterized protein (DUF1697 family)